MTQFVAVLEDLKVSRNASSAKHDVHQIRGVEKGVVDVAIHHGATSQPNLLMARFVISGTSSEGLTADLFQRESSKDGNVAFDFKVTEMYFLESGARGQRSYVSTDTRAFEAEIDKTAARRKLREVAVKRCVPT